MNLPELETKALAAADRCLMSNGYIALDDVFLELGALDTKLREDWRFGRVPCLEHVIRVNLSKINAVCRAIHASARQGNLKASWTAYFGWGKGPRRPLQFTKSGDPKLERVWATHYLHTKPTLQQVSL
jgi:hypothetical protein